MQKRSLNRIVFWVNEREKVRKAKEAGLPKPWSRDKTMQTVYFCNIDREDDKVTKWIRQQYSANVHHPTFTANICMARLVNKIESLAALKYQAAFNERRFRKVANERQPFWGNAYVVTTHGQKMSKVDYAVGILQNIWRFTKSKNLGTTLAETHWRLSMYEGFGSFMAAQVVADLKNTKGHPLQQAKDWYTWSAPGPGSLRGLGWIYGRNVGASEYPALIKEVKSAIGKDIPLMDEQNFQNCLCEFSKYMKVSTGAGRSKRKYDGEKS